MGNRKVRVGITELVWKKAENDNGEPYGKVGTSVHINLNEITVSFQLCTMQEGAKLE